MTSLFKEDCLTCKSIQGIIHLSAYPRIYESKYWVVEHMSPCAIKGWIVVALKRHCTGLHELTSDEFIDFAGIAKQLCSTIKTLLNSEKEYMMQFAEGDGFGHVHFHIISRLTDWPLEFKGINVFNAINQNNQQMIPDSILRLFVSDFSLHFNSII
jgi:diadenosine tetraphosphate (Ap4A) HIT family hydrolase